MTHYPYLRVWDSRQHHMYYLDDLDPDTLLMNTELFIEISSEGWKLKEKGYGTIVTDLAGALMVGTDQFDTGDRELTKGDRIYANDIVLQEEQAPGNPTGILKIIGIVKMLDGAWVIDTGSEAVPLFSETATNTILGDVFTTPYLTEALGCERQQKYS
ncbi:hypothetical protein [Bacillus phage SBSphiJ7]|nr:hypothetical protein [Bacillus phage SBSphiJ7]